MTKPSGPATSAMTEGWHNNHLNNMAELLTPHCNGAIVPTPACIVAGLPLALIAQHWARPWIRLLAVGLQPACIGCRGMCGYKE